MELVIRISWIGMGKALARCLGPIRHCCYDLQPWVAREDSDCTGVPWNAHIWSLVWCFLTRQANSIGRVCFVKQHLWDSLIQFWQTFLGASVLCAIAGSEKANRSMLAYRPFVVGDPTHSFSQLKGITDLLWTRQHAEDIVTIKKGWAQPWGLCPLGEYW